MYVTADEVRVFSRLGYEDSAYDMYLAFCLEVQRARSTGVLKPNRNKGIGTTMVRHAMEFLKSQGMMEVQLGDDASNPTKAIELYRKVGFKIVRKNLAYTKKIYRH